MKKILRAPVWLYLCFLLLTSAACTEPEAEMELIIYPGNNKVHKMIPLDVNGDQVMERATMGSGGTNYITVQSYSLPNRVAGQVNIETLGDFLPKKNPDGGEIIIGTIHTDGFSFFYREYNLDGDLLRQGLIVTVKDTDRSGEWQGQGPWLAGFVDSNSDGYLDPVIALSGEYDKTPRAIYVMDGKTCEELWHKDYGTLISAKTVIVDDILGNGTNQILFGSKAAGNNVVVGDNTDYKSYIGLLDNQGNEIWEEEVGGEFSQVLSLHAVDFDGDGVKEIVYNFVVKKIRSKNLPAIYLRSGQTGEIIKHSGSRKNLRNSILIGDFFNQSKNSILVFDYDDYLTVYDKDFNVEKRIKIEGLCDVSFFSDINGDGKKEFFTKDSDILSVYTNDFKFIAKAPIPPQRETRYYNRNIYLDSEEFNEKPGRMHIFIRSGFSRVELRETPVSIFFTAGRVATIILLPLGIALFVYGVWSQINGRRRLTMYRDVFIKSYSDVQTGVLILDGRREILSSNQLAMSYLGNQGKDCIINDLQQDEFPGKIRDLLNALSKRRLVEISSRVARKNPDGSENLFSVRIQSLQEHSASRPNYIVFIREIEDLVSGLSSETIAISQELMHKIKTLILVYKNDIHHLESSYQDADLGDDFTEVIEELKKVTGAIEGIARNYVTLTRLDVTGRQNLNLNKFIQETLDTALETNNKKIKFVYELDSSLPEVSVNPGQIQSVLLNLVENSIESIPMQGKIIIRTEPYKKLGTNLDSNTCEYFSFTVEDTGKGFDMKLAQRIFDPGFSDKAGNSGLGMTISKRIVELHGGEMVVQSIEGKGTSIAVRIPYEK